MDQFLFLLGIQLGMECIFDFVKKYCQLFLTKVVMEFLYSQQYKKSSLLYVACQHLVLSVFLSFILIEEKKWKPML